MARLRDHLRRSPPGGGPDLGRDHLTGLPRRGGLLGFGPALLTAAAAVGDVVAVLIVDIDHLKQVNDALGHRAGDRLLVEATRRLRAVLSEEAVLARVGGDEFAALQRCRDEAGAGALAAATRAALRFPVVAGGIEMPGGASVGLAVSGRDGQTLAELTAAADQAMYVDKRRHLAAPRGPRRHSVADAVALTRDLARAVSEPGRGELRLHHQPQVDATGEVVGFEALVRWAHPSRGLLGPADFIPLAERHGLAADLDELAIRQALDDHRLLSTWRPGVRQSVNLSAYSLLDPSLAPRLREVLAAAGVPGERLTLEVSESATGLPLSDERLAALAEVGFHLSVQQFGAARASITTLSVNPLISEIKLPPALVSDLVRSPQVSRLVSGLISAARGLGLRVVAAGVENAVSARRLLELGCDVLQGFGIAPPMTLFDAADWVAFWSRTSQDHPVFAHPRR
ncbi:MAG: bifunctional diguanylate cyclase/phosphodiesterase [Nocardioides sp.]|nr:bifunctional diguanylate cyclase/phosphodiesterase [Nocardioides sp.]